MNIGFTGTRKGMTSEQEAVVDSLLFYFNGRYGDVTLLEGDCTGADDQAYRLARNRGIRIETFPPTDKRYACNHKADVVHSAQPYLVRNASIVKACDVLIAAPGEFAERLRSGTWSTIRLAKKKPVYTVYPDGTMEYENGQMRQL